MVGEVVVVLDGLEGGLLTIEAKVVDSDGFGEERGQGRDHGEARAKDGHEGDGGGWGRSGGGGVGVVQVEGDVRWECLSRVTWSD